MLEAKLAPVGLFFCFDGIASDAGAEFNDPSVDAVVHSLLQARVESIIPLSSDFFHAEREVRSSSDPYRMTMDVMWATKIATLLLPLY